MRFIYVLMVVALVNLVGVNKCVAGPLINIAAKALIKRNRDQNVETLQKEYTQKKFSLQFKISRHLDEISSIMSQGGLSNKWQVDYFSNRAHRAFTEGLYLIGGYYMEYAKKIKHDLDFGNDKGSQNENK